MAHKKLPICDVYYIPPEEPLTQEIIETYGSARKPFIKKEVNLEDVYASIKDVLYRFIDAEASRESLSPDAFRWDMFDVLGIPDQSYLKVGSNGTNASRLDIMYSFWKVFEPFNTDDKIQNGFTFPAQGGRLNYYQGNQLQVAWSLLVKTDLETRDIFTRLNGTNFSMSSGEDEAYKIHLCPKQPYILYTMCRLFSIAKKHPIFYSKNITMKIVFSLRATKPREENTFILKTAGGALPTLVFYCNDDVETVKKILEILLAEFESEVDILGAMTPDYKYRVLPFNVRLNSLIFYALGDRSYKNDARTNFARSLPYFKDKNIPKLFLDLRNRYTMPRWIESMLETCDSKQAARIGDLSMRFLGKNICLPETRAMLADPNCLDDICWFSALKDMLSPLTIRGLGLDTSKGTDEEADTSENNVVEPVNPPPPLSRRKNLTFYPTMNNNNPTPASPSVLPGYLTRKQGGKRKIRKQTRRIRGGSGFSVQFKGIEAANNLRPRNQTLKKPNVSWSADLNEMFTLVMWDPDAPNPSFVHWIVTNIPGSQIHKGTTVVSYMPPSPPSGTHRYYITLLKQSVPVSAIPVNRSGFSLDAFTRQYGVNKVGQKMIRVAAGKN